VTTDSSAMARPARRPMSPVLTAALLTAAIAIATLAGAWYMQLVWGLSPCELCLKQRYAYYAIAPLGLLVALAASRGAPRPLLVFGLLLIALFALGNASLGVYHAGVEWGFWQGPTECTGPVGNLGSAGNLLERLDSVKIVRCDEVQFRFLGISLAGYNALISALMAVIAVRGMARTARR
jgi:disulfide bond formation protein DsbB